MKGVKEQLRMNRAEEKQRLLEEKNTNDENRKLIKLAGMATGPGPGSIKVSFAGSGCSSPPQPGSSASSMSDGEGGMSVGYDNTPGDDEGGTNRTSHRQSNLTRANIQAHQASVSRGGGVHQSGQGGSHHQSQGGATGGRGEAGKSVGTTAGGASKSSLVSHATGSKVSVAAASAVVVAEPDGVNGESAPGHGKDVPRNNGAATGGGKQHKNAGTGAGGKKKNKLTEEAKNESETAVSVTTASDDQNAQQPKEGGKHGSDAEKLTGRRNKKRQAPAATAVVVPTGNEAKN
jgi:hypothetical protein